MAAARREANCSSCWSQRRRCGQRKKNSVSNAGPLSLSCSPVNPFFPTALACSLLVYDGIMRKKGEGRLIEMRSRPAKQMCLSPQGTQRKNVRQENILQISTISTQPPAAPKCYKLHEKSKRFRKTRFVHKVKFLHLQVTLSNYYIVQRSRHYYFVKKTKNFMAALPLAYVSRESDTYRGLNVSKCLSVALGT